MSEYNQGGENALLLRFRRIRQMGIMSEKENQIVVYQPNETVRLDVRLENETVWLNQSRLGDLFGVDRTVINRHIQTPPLQGVFYDGQPWDARALVLKLISDAKKRKGEREVA